VKDFEFQREIARLDREGKRQEVVALMRKYGLFTDETAVAEYLRGRLERVQA
jgi:hypothetical protein